MTSEAWRGDPYNLAHLAVKKLWGSASVHPCVDCDKPALDWSLKADPVGPVQGDPPYSSTVDDYEARCRACHIAVGDNVSAAREKLASLRSPEYNKIISERTREGIRQSRERRVAAGGSGSWAGGLRT